MTDLPIRSITDTARWVAVYRADESDRPDALFNDPYARMLAGERGERIVQSMANGRENSWSFVARTYLFDQLIQQQVAQGCNVVINLACGLDTRAYRLKLPQNLRWFDVDLPEIIAEMNQMLPALSAQCRHQRVAHDLSDRVARISFFQSLADEVSSILIVTEGLVGYLTPEDNAALAYDLAHMPGAAYWILDLMSPGILPLIQEEMGSLLQDANSPLIFAPEEGEGFYHLLGWEPIYSASKRKTALSIGRLPASLHAVARLPEPEGPKGLFPWSGVCLFRNIKNVRHS